MDESKLVGAILRRLEDLAVQKRDAVKDINKYIKEAEHAKAEAARLADDLEKVREEKQAYRLDFEGAQKQLASEKGVYIVQLEQARRISDDFRHSWDQAQVTIGKLRKELELCRENATKEIEILTGERQTAQQMYHEVLCLTTQTPASLAEPLRINYAKHGIGLKR